MPDTKQIAKIFETAIEKPRIEKLPVEGGRCIEHKIMMVNITRQEYLATLPCRLCGIYSPRGMILCDGCDTAWHLTCIQ